MPPCIKTRFETKNAAWEMLDRIDTLPRPIGWKKPVRAYRCPRCNGWHLTSSAHRRFRRAA